ncbi:MAG: hypothetical protein CMI16_12955 [Opitutaceae bacterium]|nr:hypothetical protein [Opitutaceae bacterium]
MRLAVEQVESADVVWVLFWIGFVVLITVPAALWWRRRRQRRARLLRMLAAVRQAAAVDGEAKDAAILPLERKAKRMGI